LNLELQHLVAVRPLRTATLSSMEWGEYWRSVCAPKLKARKDELGRSVPEREIAAYVESNSGKKTTRSLVNLFLLGEREPYISQFFALCDKLGVSPDEVLTNDAQSVSQRTPLRRTGQRARQRSGIKTRVSKLKISE